MRFFALVTVFSALIISCDRSDCKIHEEKIDGVVRVFVHEPYHFSLLVKHESNGSELDFQNYKGWEINEFRVFSDVASDKEMWAKKIFDGRGFERQCRFELQIHIHSVNDIHSAGWDHGKFGQGQTNVIE